MASEIKTYPPVFGSTSLKAYYRFENGALTTDSTAGAHTLSAISDPAEDVAGKFGSAIALDGNDAYSASDHADFKPTGAFTVGAWVKTSATGASQTLFQSYSANTNIAGIIVFLFSGDNKIYCYSGRNTGTVLGTNYQRIISTNTLADGNWHFVAYTWDTTNLNLYLDGVADTAAVAWANAPAYAATNYVRVGCGNKDGSNENFLTGSLDDVFLINGAALTAQQISDIYYGRCNKFFQLF